MLVIIDVRGRRIPARGPAVVIEQWVVLAQEPAVSAVFAAHPLLDLKGNRVGEGPLPRLAKSLSVVRRDSALAESVRANLRERQARIFEGNTIGVDRRAVGI